MHSQFSRCSERALGVEGTPRKCTHGSVRRGCDFEHESDAARALAITFRSRARRNPRCAQVHFATCRTQRGGRTVRGGRVECVLPSFSAKCPSRRINFTRSSSSSKLTPPPQLISSVNNLMTSASESCELPIALSRSRTRSTETSVKGTPGSNGAKYTLPGVRRSRQIACKTGLPRLCGTARPAAAHVVGGRPGKREKLAPRDGRCSPQQQCELRLTRWLRFW